MRNTITQIIWQSPAKLITCFWAATICLFFLSGCQSNTVYFATNTQFGIRAGVDSKQIPEVEIGYNRQEGVMLPLTAENGTNPPANVANFTSDYTEGSTTSKDAYSVLATFDGSSGGSSGSTNGAGASLSVAQYFATGNAAVLLASKGGAAAVGGAPAATDSLEATSNKIAHAESDERAAIYAYVTSPDQSLDKSRLTAIATLTGPPFPPNDVNSFLNPPAGGAPPTVSAFEAKLNPHQPWSPYVDTWYARYTNIVGSPEN